MLKPRLLLSDQVASTHMRHAYSWTSLRQAYYRFEHALDLCVELKALLKSA